MKNQNSSSEWIMAVPHLIGLAFRIGFDRRVPWETKAALGAGALYIISPIDGIPDFIPVLGQLEDLAIAIMLIDGMVNHLDYLIVREHWRGAPETLDRIGKIASTLTGFLPRMFRERIMKHAFKGNWPSMRKASLVTG